MTVKEIQELYEENFYANSNDRYFNLENLQTYINQSAGKFSVIGKSTFGKPIYKTILGDGKTKILIWSQMHGNESTGTRSMLDVLNILSQNNSFTNQIKSELEIHFIPMLNPDGAEIYSRRHPIGIDPNRDFLDCALVETQLLLNQVKENNFQLLFNLHDQRTIFGVDNKNPASLSFLSPSENIERTITHVRKKSMGVVAYMNHFLQQLIPNQIGRYTDEFYPTATGDNFTKMGFPCVLIEAGYFPNDYERQKTKKYNAIAILYGLYFLATEKDWQKNYEQYVKIPENHANFFDIIYRNVTIKSLLNTVDIGIQFTEKLNNETKKIDFIAEIQEIGNLTYKFGYQEFNCDKQEFTSNENDYPKIGQIANFKLGKDWEVVNGKII